MFTPRIKQLAVDGGIGLALVGLALWLRATRLDQFVTADEHNWVYRSGLFLHAVLQQDWAGTSVWLTPAVTTTWLGSLGLSSHYLFHGAAIDQPLLDWLVSFSRTRVNMVELLPLRWTMAIFTALMIGLIYGLARKLWSRPVAILGVLFILSDPHLLSLSRIIGHDAPATLFITASLLSLLYARRRLGMTTPPDSEGLEERRRPGRYPAWVALSGIMAGLGVLSKAPAMFLIPFAGLLALADIWQRRGGWRRWLWALLIWGGCLWGTFVLVWPAAWVNPVGQTWAVINNAFLYSSGDEDADIQPFYAVPELGMTYYLVNGAYKLSPLVLIGGLLALWAGGQQLRRPNSSIGRLLRSDIFWLLLFALLFGLFMTLGAKRSPRYILPAFPALAFVAAWGWATTVDRFSSKQWQPAAAIASLAALNLGLTLNYAPYYFTYFNPLLGGAYTAPSLVRIGWGEGLDEVGRWLQQQPDALAQKVGARYKTGLDPFFSGAVDSPVSADLDYVAFYIKQSQSGYPLPEILSYFESQGALHHVWLNGIDYAQIYRGPAMIPLEQAGPADRPLAYRPHTLYAPLGGSLTVDVLWPVSVQTGPATVSIQAPDSRTIAQAPAPIETIAPGVKLSRHTFAVPPDLPRDTYRLSVNDDRPLGAIAARLMEPPPDFTPLDFIVQYLKLRGYRFEVADEQLRVDLAWQSWPREVTDFTVYVQLLDENGQRVAGVDIAPQPGFSQLDRKEVLITHYALPLPDHLPPGAYQLLIGLYYFAGDQLINVGAETLPEPIIIGQPGE